MASFPRRCDVISWAPLHGGFRTDVSHVLIHRFRGVRDMTSAGKSLRQAASKIGLKGSFVGIATTANPIQYGIGRSEDNDLSVCAISVSGHGKSPEASKAPVGDASALLGSICILLINQHVSHEAMLEAMCIATEAKVRAIDRQAEGGGTFNLGFVVNRLDCVGVAVDGDRRRYYNRSHKILIQLIAAACKRSLGSGLSQSASVPNSSSTHEVGACHLGHSRF